MKKVILIHCYTSSPKLRKYQIISRELAKLSIEHSIPAMPGDLYPKSRDWLAIIDKEVRKSKEPVVLVGHSLGTRAVLLYLDKYNQKVDTVILFAAFNNDYRKNGERRNWNYKDFFDYALNLEKVKEKASKFIIIHSKDDDSIEYQQALDISNDLAAELITYQNMGHLSGEEKAKENAAVFLKYIKLALSNY